MSYFDEYALVFAVSLPMVVIVSAQVVLFLGGERGTLLIPGLNDYPTIQYAKNDKEEGAQPRSVVRVRAVAQEVAPSRLSPNGGAAELPNRAEESVSDQPLTTVLARPSSRTQKRKLR